MNNTNDTGGVVLTEVVDMSVSLRLLELEARHDGAKTIEAPAITLDEINYEYALRQMAGVK